MTREQQLAQALLPCPFCKSIDSPACVSSWDDGCSDENCDHSECFYVVCDSDTSGCGASSGADASLVAAIAIWNRRPASDALDRDAARLDWLERMHVEVRIPLRYGSRSLFHSTPEDEEGFDARSNLRAAIDSAIAAAKGGGK